MKKITLIATLFCSLFLLTTTYATTDTGTLTITVTHIAQPKGVIRLALYNSADSYSKAGKSGSTAYKTATGEIAKGGISTIIFNKLPYGDYAIKLFQDEDNSGKFKTGMFGIPKEGFGFSQNPAVKNGAPAYDKVVFTFNAQNTDQTITLQYYQ